MAETRRFKPSDPVHPEPPATTARTRLRAPPEAVGRIPRNGRIPPLSALRPGRPAAAPGYGGHVQGVMPTGGRGR
ncbi:hypothetical protein ACFWIB_02535 [Streptomyces sp. NPDC127051]|uniref:hypothetical protein n=1 Tax=Streptomyces sp. NPDC127051 TaxID=3347119 RepID=UPI0036566E3A